MKTLIIILLNIAFLLPVESQISTREIREKTEKGTDLLTNGKFDEAIGVFTEILRSDPTQGKALLLRARAKYEVGAYKGVVNDCFAYMEKYGIDEEVAGLLGKTEAAMGNYKQALSYLKVAIFFYPTGEEYLLDRANIYYDLGLDEDACADWTVAARNGSSEAQMNVSKYCSRVQVPSDNKPTTSDRDKVKEPTKDKPVEVVDTTPDQPTNNDRKDDVPIVTNTGSGSSGNTSNPDNSGSSEDDVVLDDDTSFEDEYPIDYAVNEIYIDNELSIEIGNGIGSRKVVEIPDMLILSDKSGEVVVDVCLSTKGEVIYSQLNEELSTIKTKGLVSLALRKSEQFWFERINRDEHCGTITFVITAG